MTSDDDNVITIEDVLVLNRSAVSRTAELARQVGTGLLVVGALGVAAFLWLVVRQQQMDSGFDSVGVVRDISLAERIDLVVGGVPILLLAGVVAGAGMVLRLLADAAVSVTGGSVTGYEAGDTLTDETDDTDDAVL